MTPEERAHTIVQAWKDHGIVVNGAKELAIARHIGTLVLRLLGSAERAVPAARAPHPLAFHLAPPW